MSVFRLLCDLGTYHARRHSMPEEHLLLLSFSESDLAMTQPGTKAGSCCSCGRR